MAQLASLVVPMGALPQPDRSWLDGLASMGGDIIGELGARKSFGGLADRIATPASVTPQQSGGFLSGLVGGGRQQQTMAAPVGKVDRGQFSSVAPRLINDLSRDFGLSPEQAAGVVGQLGHESAGFATLQEVNPLVEGSRGGYGYAQWTGPRRKAFEAWSAENGLDPTSYDANYGFLAHELKNTPEGSVLDTVRSAPDAMAAGRAFTDGFLRPGIPGYDSRDNWTRRALAYAGQPQASGAVDAVNALAEGGRDTSAAYVDPAVSAPNSYAADPSAPSRAPMQVADAGGGLIAQGVTPIERGGVDPALIQSMLRDPNLRETGLKLWAANVQGQKASEPWQFVNLPDGTLARANQQTGAVERLGNFAKPDNETVVVGDDLVRRSDGTLVYRGQPKDPASWNEYQKAKGDGFEGSYADWEKVKVPGTTINNIPAGEGEKFYENLDKKNAETFAAMSESGTQARARLPQIDRLETLLAMSPSGAEAATKLWLGDLGVNTEGLDGLQATRALLEKMVPEQRPPGSGPMSDADIAMFRNSLPRVINQPGGNTLILQTMRGIAQYEMQMGEIADMVADRAITPAEGRKRVRELVNPIDAFNALLRKGGSENAGPPEGVDPDVWSVMTEEEKRLWGN